MSARGTQTAIAAELWEGIRQAVNEVVREGRRCFICIAGNSGCGKSVLGKALRKRGVSGVRPSEVLVIDDGVASVPFLGVFRRRVKFRSNEKDHLEPFKRYFDGKKLIVYVNSQPTRRVDACDILIEVRCSEALRQEHLTTRNVDGAKRLADTAGYRLLEPRAKARLLVENDGSAFHLKTADEPLAC